MKLGNLNEIYKYGEDISPRISDNFIYFFIQSIRRNCLFIGKIRKWELSF